MLKVAICIVAVVFALLFLFSFMPLVTNTTTYGQVFFWLGQAGLLLSLIVLLSMKKPPRK